MQVEVLRRFVAVRSSKLATARASAAPALSKVRAEVLGDVLVEKGVIEGGDQLHSAVDIVEATARQAGPTDRPRLFVEVAKANRGGNVF